MMKRLTATGVLGGIVSFFCLVGPVEADGLRAWGSNGDRQVSSLPAGTDYIAVAAGDAHALALKSNGTVVAWGQNGRGQCNVPGGLYSAIGAGADFSLAIRKNGSIAAWGSDTQRQVSGAPSGNDFVSVDGGQYFAVALRQDGSIVAWGSDTYGQVSLAPQESGFVAVAAGDAHAVAIRSDGTLVSWGNPRATAGTPSGTFTAVAAGGNQCVAICSDGSLAWWGEDRYGYELATVPTGTDYVSVAAGYLHVLALKADGSVVGWGAGRNAVGYPNWGQAAPPEAMDYADIVCGLYFSLALTGEAPEMVLSDNFDDNTLGGSWRLVADDPAMCRVKEADKKLELIATAGTERLLAFCVGNGWGLDATKDFAFRVDYRYVLSARGDGGVSLLLAVNGNDAHTRALQFGAGACSSYPYFWHEAADGTMRRSLYVRRSQESGSLYVSYDANLNELYLSAAGYGKANALATTNMLSLDDESEHVVFVGLGGVSECETIEAGNACLDNFKLDSGAMVTMCLTDVYRFWSPVVERHFYTTSSDEKDLLIRDYADVWTFEGVAFRTATTAALSGLSPVYAFQAQDGQSQFYTISEREKDSILGDFAHAYRYDGVAFYAYPEGQQPSGSRVVYRFLSLADDSHFYTANQAEADTIRSLYSQYFAYEGIAFYACE